MKSIADAIPTSKLVVIPNSGHMTTMENAGDVNTALEDFLKMFDV